MVLVVILEVTLGLAMLDLVQRRLSNVNVATLNQFRHLTIEEGQE